MRAITIRSRLVGPESTQMLRQHVPFRDKVDRFITDNCRVSQTQSIMYSVPLYVARKHIRIALTSSVASIDI